MLDFSFLEKSLGIDSPPPCMIFQEIFFLCYIKLTGQILLSDYLYFLRY